MSEHSEGTGGTGGTGGNDSASTPAQPNPQPMSATIEGKAEREVIPSEGGETHIEYRLRVTAPPTPTESAPRERKPLALALVLDRSGSMAGGKLDTAKYAASAVLDRLDERDLVTLTVFDDRIDLIQPLAKVTPELKESVRAELARIQPRGGTALFDGWQQGTQVLVDGHATVRDRLAHCFLLTDGQANQGETNIENIAMKVGQVQATSKVGTSTFGIGDDYAEELLGPMAAAGGGQFHHLDEPGEMARTFVTQLGDLLAVALPRVRLELDLPEGAHAQVISAYWAHPGVDNGGRVTTVGDLLAGEQRSIVYSMTFPAGTVGDQVKVRGRLVWPVEGGEQSSPWDEVTLTYATVEVFRSTAVSRPVSSRVHSESARHAQLEAMMAYKTHDDTFATLRRLDQEVLRLTAAAQDDPDLQLQLEQLRETRDRIASRQATPRDLKRSYSRSQLFSRSARPIPLEPDSNAANGTPSTPPNQAQAPGPDTSPNSPNSPQAPGDPGNTGGGAPV